MRAILLGPKLGSKQERATLLKSVHISSKDLLVGVDGGTALWFEQGFQPDFAVGDWDSLRNKNKILSKVAHVTLSKDKNRNDLFYAVVAAIQAGAREILCLGVTGGRPDHHLANMIDLAQFSSGAFGKLKSVQAKGVEADYVFLSGRIPFWRGSLPKGALMSLFAMGQRAAGVTLSGFRYPLKNFRLAPSSLGLSNRAMKRNCEVRLRKGQLLVILPRNGY